MLKVQDVNQENKDIFIKLCSDFYTSDAVLHSIPLENIEKTAQLAIEKSPFIRCVLLEYESQVVGYALLSFTYSNEVGGLVVLLEEIMVLDKFRGKGIAKKFFSWLFENYNSSTERYRLEVSHSNERVRGLYKKMGFTDLHYLQMVLDK